jgi:hypothetical protein
VEWAESAASEACTAALATLIFADEQKGEAGEHDKAIKGSIDGQHQAVEGTISPGSSGMRRQPEPSDSPSLKTRKESAMPPAIEIRTRFKYIGAENH